MNNIRDILINKSEVKKITHAELFCDNHYGHYYIKYFNLHDIKMCGKCKSLVCKLCIKNDMSMCVLCSKEPKFIICGSCYLRYSHEKKIFMCGNCGSYYYTCHSANIFYKSGIIKCRKCTTYSDVSEK